jgi:hypothetical protein
VIVWVICVALVIAIAVARANQVVGDRGDAFRIGFATAAVVIAFALALLIGFAVRRTRGDRGIPLWSAPVAVGLSFSLWLVAAGNTVAANVACVPPRNAYGAPPAGWDYGPANAKTDKKIRDAMSLSAGANVSLASPQEGDNVVLVAIPHAETSFVEGFERGGREVGATTSKGPNGTSEVTYPHGEAFAVVGTKGCNAVIVDGVDEQAVKTVAQTVFR